MPTPPPRLRLRAQGHPSGRSDTVLLEILWPHSLPLTTGKKSDVLMKVVLVVLSVVWLCRSQNEDYDLQDAVKAAMQLKADGRNISAWFVLQNIASRHKTLTSEVVRLQTELLGAIGHFTSVLLGKEYTFPVFNAVKADTDVTLLFQLYGLPLDDSFPVVYNQYNSVMRGGRFSLLHS